MSDRKERGFYDTPRGLSLLRKHITVILHDLQNAGSILSFTFSSQKLKEDQLHIVVDFGKFAGIQHSCDFFISLYSREGGSPYVVEEYSHRVTLIINQRSFVPRNLISLVVSFVQKRKRGFEAEELLLDIVNKWMENHPNPNRAIRSIRHGSIQEDIEHKDFFIQMLIDGKTYHFSFDLKTSLGDQESLERKRDMHPTIFVPFNDLKKRDHIVIDKIIILGQRLYNRNILKKDIPMHKIHV